MDMERITNIYLYVICAIITGPVMIAMVYVIMQDVYVYTKRVSKGDFGRTGNGKGDSPIFGNKCRSQKRVQLTQEQIDSRDCTMSGSHKHRK